MTDNQQIFLLEKYLSRALEAKECIRVELLLLTDETFGKLYDTMRSALGFIAYEGRENLLKKMQKWEETIPVAAMENNNIQKKIEDYLVGKLTVDEILEFEKKLKEDPQFKQQFEETKRLFDGIQYAGRKKLKDRMQRIEATLDSKQPAKPKIKRFNSKFILGIAAGLALWLALHWLINLGDPAISTDQLFAQEFKVYASEIIQRSAGADPAALPRIKETFPNHSSELIYKAFLSYEEGKYDEAIPQFNHLLEEYPSPTLTFFVGQSLLATDQYDASIKAFDHYLDTHEQRYFTQSTYYKGLALLGQGKKDELKDTWQLFIKDDCHYCEKARVLLEQMK